MPRRKKPVETGPLPEPEAPAVPRQTERASQVRLKARRPFFDANSRKVKVGDVIECEVEFSRMVIKRGWVDVL